MNNFFLSTDDSDNFLPKKKRRSSTQDVVNKIDDSISRFLEYQEKSDKEVFEREKEREKREEEREEKRRKSDQEFFLQLARVLKG